MKTTTLALIGLFGASRLIGCAQPPVGNVTVADSAPAATESTLKMAVLASDDGHAHDAPATRPAEGVANKPAMPPGHPDISSMQKPAAASGDKPQMPTGHPDIGGMMKPNAAPAAAGGKMPAGHPDISQMQKAPSTQPAATVGTLTIHAVQGTAGAAAIGADDVLIELYNGEQVMHSMKAKLTDKGTLTVDGLPLGVPFQPVVTVTHGGVEYKTVGTAMDGANAEQSLDVAVYEPTENPVPWTVKMEHVMVTPTEQGLQVVEMLAVENPTDRAWIGALGADGKRATTVITVPASAQNVQSISGSHDCCLTIEPGRVVNTMALPPGVTQFRIAYLMPITNGQAEVSLTASAAVKHLMVFVPDDGTAVMAEGLEAAGVKNMGNGNTRFYKAGDVPAGAQMKLTISGLADVAVAPAAAKGATQAAQVIGGVGAVLIMLLGGAFLFTRSTKTSNRAHAAGAKGN